MHTIDSPADFDRMLAEPVAILLKHSTSCPISARAYRQLSDFHAKQPETPVYVLDVHAQSRLSAQVVERFGIGHDSPQAIVVRLGRPSFSATHHQITAAGRSRELMGKLGGKRG